MLLEGGDSGGATVIGVHSAGGGGGSTVDDVSKQDSFFQTESRTDRDRTFFFDAGQFTIKNSSSSLERRINRWAADTLAAHVRNAPPPPGSQTSSSHGAPSPSSPASPSTNHLALIPLAEALYRDVENAYASPFLVGLNQMQFDYPGLGIVVQSLLRHAMSQLLCDGIVNKLLVTNSEEANQLSFFLRRPGLVVVRR